VQNELERVSALVAPIASDLDIDVYDVERRGGTIRVTLDARAGAEEGISLDTLALATRLISRELDHDDPIAGRYTLEVTSPGMERPLRTPEHFRREVGKEVLVRLRDVTGDDRRVRGLLAAADDTGVIVLDEAKEEHRVEYSAIDQARTVFEWGPAPKPGKGKGQGGKKPQHRAEQTGSDSDPQMDKEKQPS
jgi:ribosome maturation factor RimP